MKISYNIALGGDVFSSFPTFMPAIRSCLRMDGLGCETSMGQEDFRYAFSSPVHNIALFFTGDEAEVTILLPAADYFPLYSVATTVPSLRF